MAKRIEIEHVSAWFGSFKALDDVTIDIEPKQVTALIGPSGCGKSTFLRIINRTARGRARCPGRGPGAARRRRRVRRRRRPGRRPPVDRHGVPAAQPVPHHVDPRQRRGRAPPQRRAQQVRPRRRGRALAQAGRAVGRGRSSPGQARRQPVRRPAAAAVHRPGHRRRARRGAADGRAVLGPRPHLDPEDRRPDRRPEGQYTIVIVTHNMQEAARRQRHDGVLQHQRRRASRAAGGGGPTEKIFTKPDDPAPRTTSPGGSADGRGPARRLPPRPRGDRPEGGAALRPGERGPERRHRRLPGRRPRGGQAADGARQGDRLALHRRGGDRLPAAGHAVADGQGPALPAVGHAHRARAGAQRRPGRAHRGAPPAASPAG